MPTTMDRSHRRFLLFLVILMSVLFLWMVRSFLITILLAAIFAAMAMPLHRFVRKRVGGNDALASILTLLILIVAVGLPIFGFLGLVANQAIEISQAARPWIQSQIADAGSWDEFLSQFPFLGRMLPEEADLLQKLSEFTTAAGRFLADSVVEVSRGYRGFLASSVRIAVLDVLFPQRWRQDHGSHPVLYPSPRGLRAGFGRESCFRDISSPKRITGYWHHSGWIGRSCFLASRHSWLGVLDDCHDCSFYHPSDWLSPGLDSCSGIPIQYWLNRCRGLAFTIWCVLVVGTVDNFLRPRLVGKDTKMPDILVLISTLGGIFLFGAVGFILGPIIAALFLGTIYIYGEMFADSLGEKPASMTNTSKENIFSPQLKDATDEGAQ